MNHYFKFQKKDGSVVFDVLALIDCTSYKNNPLWEVHEISIDHFSKIQWTVCPDPIHHFELYKQYVCDVLAQKETNISQWSLARVLTSNELFPGVGAYLRSEILHRLWKHWMIAPWEICGSLSFKEDNILIILISIFRILVFQLKTFYPSYDILIHDKPKVKAFYFRFLEAYQKKDSNYWKFTSAGTKKGTLYTFCSGKPSAEIMKKENWQLHKTCKATSNNLGVGPLCWHSVGDYKNIIVREKNEQSISFKSNRKTKRKGKLNRLRNNFEKSVHNDMFILLYKCNSQ